MDLVSVTKITMKRDKILLTISAFEDLEKYKKLGITNFLFPLQGFSVGYTSFSLEEIANVSGYVYILVNRLLTDEDIDNFLALNIPKNVKGFVVEDTGLFYELKGKGYELINFQNHLNNNYKTINYWLKYFESLVISTDITREEIETILKETTKPLVLNVFGYPMIMYSRRTLVSNYFRHYDKKPKYDIVIRENISKNEFLLKESHCGTAVFDNKIIDIRPSLDNFDDEKIKFYLINTEFCDFEMIKKVIIGEPLTDTTEGFLDKKTIYRVGDIQ